MAYTQGSTNKALPTRLSPNGSSTRVGCAAMIAARLPNEIVNIYKGRIISIPG
jgi:hypothetical protein